MDIKPVGAEGEDLSTFDPKDMSPEEIKALQEAFYQMGVAGNSGLLNLKSKRGVTKPDHDAPKNVAKRKAKRKAARKARKMTLWHNKKDKKNLRNR